MSRFTTQNEALAAEIIARYPRPKSALIPLLHLAQEQTGHITVEAMRQVAELTGSTGAEVAGTGSFYDMFKFHPVGCYLICICTNLSCALLGAEELLAHAERTLGIDAGGTSEDGMFTLEEVECIAACTEAPCLAVNHRYRHRVSSDDFDRLINDIRANRTRAEIPEHGTLARIRQVIPADRLAGICAPEMAREAPVWLARNNGSESA